MPISVFDSTTDNVSATLDTSSFIQKSYLREKYVESSIEENIDRKNQNRIRIIRDSITVREPGSRLYVDIKNRHNS